jgi:hypothetical protein
MTKVCAKIKITGTKPLLINTFPLETLDEGKSKSGTAGKDETLWKKTVLITPDRELYVFSSYLVGAIVKGAKNIKVGKGSLANKVGSTLECSPDILILNGLKLPPDNEITKNTNDEVYIDVRSVVNPMTKGRNIRYRIACKAGWGLTANILWDDAQVSVEQMKQAVYNGGQYEGLGDGRKIGFGRFKVNSFQVSEE